MISACQFCYIFLSVPALPTYECLVTNGTFAGNVNTSWYQSKQKPPYP